MTDKTTDQTDPWEAYGGRPNGVSRTNLICGLALAAIATALYGAWSLYETSFYRGALPAALQTTGLVSAGSDLNPLLLLFPLRHEVCGAALHTLSSGTQSEITNHGPAFFAELRQSRGHPDRRGDFYEAWAASPMPDNRTDLLSMDLGCAGIDRDLQRDVLAAARTEGSFYTRGRSMLLVVPRLKLVVMGFD